MKGYLLAEQAFIIGDATIIESQASENDFVVVFEDDTETGYFYAAERTDSDDGMRILDALHIYTVEEISDEEKRAALKIIWSKDWLKCALVINSYCHAVFDFAAQHGFNRNAFPPPNDIWTKGDRQLTDAIVASYFG